MNTIQGNARTVHELLSGTRYEIDYYQREYRWERKQVAELLEDLTEQFHRDYDNNHEREQVQSYSHYFLGSIILSHRDHSTFIVDGQQRLTTLTLLLISLHRRQGTRPDRVPLEGLIYTGKFGKRSFNIAVPERRPALEDLFAKGEVSPSVKLDESVQTIVERYRDIDELFSTMGIDDHALPYFCDWLIENVHFVEINAMSDDDAYTIFETMNDRGLSLKPLEMLKGYLLSNIKDDGKRNRAAAVWRERVEALRKLGEDEDTDAVKAWLRARYADKVRERRKGAPNEDFERIGNEFHRWVDDKRRHIGLRSTDDYYRFVVEEMVFYTSQYQLLREAARGGNGKLESVYHVGCLNYSLQYPMLLAPLLMTDSTDVIERKLKIVSRYLDILLTHRVVNYLSLSFSYMSYRAFLTMRDIRSLSPDKLAAYLRADLDRKDDDGNVCDFDGAGDWRKGLARFGLNQWSGRYIKVLLARMTAWVEKESEVVSSVSQYLAEGRERYEIEHIWADHFEQHADEFGSESDFRDARSLFGGLLLLPKKINVSYGDLPYEDKRKHYSGQNLLARSLHPLCYDHNPGFVQFVARTGLSFRAHDHFTRADLEERGKLYRAIADRIWDPEEIVREATR